MASDTQTPSQKPVTGRCYCGAQIVCAEAHPETVAYCHYCDCTPVTAFAAFGTHDLRFRPALDAGFSTTPGVTRWFCRGRGSPLAATYDDLPGHIYVPLGLRDQATDLPLPLHAHADARLSWLHIDDTLPQIEGRSRDRLKAARET